MARKRKKSKNPETPWLKYAAIAVGCYVGYRLLKSTGLLGKNGDGGSDEDYAPYTPSPVVDKVRTIVASKPSGVRPGDLVQLQRLSKKYDITYERYKQAPADVAKAQAAVAAANSQIAAAKARAEQLRSEAKAVASAQPTVARAKNIEAAKKEMEVSGVQLKLPALERDLKVKQDNEKLPRKALRDVEAEMAKAAQEAEDVMQAAEIAVGASSGKTVAVER